MSLPFPHVQHPVKLSLYVHVDFFPLLCFSMLSPKIAYSPQLLYCFQGNENGAWHCGNLMQIAVQLAVLQDNKSAATWAFIKDSLTTPEAHITVYHSVSCHPSTSQMEKRDLFYYPHFIERKN